MQNKHVVMLCCAWGCADAPDLVAIPRVDGIEDFIVVNGARIGSIDYVIDVSSIAGLRLVGGALEMLDAAGAPRLRVAPPTIVAADHRTYAARLEIPDCAASRDPAPPWGRPVVAPGFTRCTVRVAWDALPLRYPVLVDPSWTTTANMMVGRQDHLAVRLIDGRVLVTGGAGSTGALASTELYDPATSTWAVAAPLVTARRASAGVLLPDGRVLVAGGTTFNDSLASAELFNPIAGTWTATGPLLDSRMHHTATLLDDGRVLVVGGEYAPVSFGCGIRTSAELWHPATGAWTATDSIGGAFEHTATLLENGDVLVAGGFGRAFNGVFCVDAAVADARIYTPGSGSSAATASLGEARGMHSATRLADGRVLVAGGASSVLLASGEVYDAQTSGWTFTANAMSGAHLQQSARLPNGRVLIADGATADEYDPMTNLWLPAPPLQVARNGLTLTLLSTGRVLAAGGDASTTSELYDPGTTSCGDGVLQVAEACDGANLGGRSCASLGYATGALACTPACTLDSTGCSLCGNGTLDPGEQCDDANTDNTDSCPTCQLARCGDGFVQAGIEQCDGIELDGRQCSDLGFAGGTLTCSPTCAYDTTACIPSGCGNGIVEADEQCDDGNEDDSDACLSTCELAFCGDGFVRTGVEQCDDGNLNDRDACRADCTIPTSCVYPPSVIPPPDAELAPKFSMTRTLDGTGFELDADLHVTDATSQDLTRCTQNNGTGGELTLCGIIHHHKTCGSLGVDSSVTCTTPVACITPPVQSCDGSMQCCTDSATISGSFSKGFTIDAKDDLGLEFGPFECSADALLTLGATGTLSHRAGPGCAECPDGRTSLEIRASVQGSGEAECKIHLMGAGVDLVTVGASLDICAGGVSHGTLTCPADLLFDLVVDVRFVTADVNLFWFHLKPFKWTLQPEEGPTCLLGD